MGKPYGSKRNRNTSWWRLSWSQIIIIITVLVFVKILLSIMDVSQHNLSQEIQEVRMRHADTGVDIVNMKHSPALMAIKDTHQPAMHHRPLVRIPHKLLTTAYVIWCGRRQFEFRNYVSLLSVMKNAKPDTLYLYYDVYPLEDDFFYNTWLQDLLDDFPFIHVRQLKGDEPGCNGHARPNMEFVRDLVEKNSGMYVNEHTILEALPMDFISYKSIDAIEDDTGRGFLLGESGVSIKAKTGTMKCHQIVDGYHYATPGGESLCVSVDQPFLPKDIWYLQTQFGSLARSIVYGTPSPLFGQLSYDLMVPNIAHMVLITGTDMLYITYLSLLSLLYIAGMEKVYIHGHQPPTGIHWDNIKHESRLEFVRKAIPSTIYGQHIGMQRHMKEIMKVDILSKYGGLCVDSDVIFVKPIDRKYFGYEVVLGYDWFPNDPFPDIINMATVLSKPDAFFIHMMLRSMKDLKGSEWNWAWQKQPYKILERHPDLVHIEPRLNVQCWQDACHPTWWPGYHAVTHSHINTKSLPDWTQDAFSYKFDTIPKQLSGPEEAKNGQGMFADMAKLILTQASKS